MCQISYGWYILEMVPVRQSMILIHLCPQTKLAKVSSQLMLMILCGHIQMHDFFQLLGSSEHHPDLLSTQDINITQFV